MIQSVRAHVTDRFLVEIGGRRVCSIEGHVLLMQSQDSAIQNVYSVRWARFYRTAQLLCLTFWLRGR